MLINPDEIRYSMESSLALHDTLRAPFELNLAQDPMRLNPGSKELQEAYRANQHVLYCLNKIYTQQTGHSFSTRVLAIATTYLENITHYLDFVASITLPVRSENIFDNIRNRCLVIAVRQHEEKLRRGST